MEQSLDTELRLGQIIRLRIRREKTGRTEGRKEYKCITCRRKKKRGKGRRRKEGEHIYEKSRENQ